MFRPWVATIQKFPLNSSVSRILFFVKFLNNGCLLLSYQFDEDFVCEEESAVGESEMCSGSFK